MVQMFMNVFRLYLDDGEESLHDHEDGNGCKDNLREQDIYLPIANVARIMKNAIPQTGKVCVSFIHIPQLSQVMNVLLNLVI